MLAGSTYERDVSIHPNFTIKQTHLSTHPFLNFKHTYLHMYIIISESKLLTTTTIIINPNLAILTLSVEDLLRFPRRGESFPFAPIFSSTTK